MMQIKVIMITQMPRDDYKLKKKTLQINQQKNKKDKSAGKQTKILYQAKIIIII